jgi:hypothetical protein
MTFLFCKAIWRYAVSGGASRLFREKLKNAAAGYSDELAHLHLLQCAVVAELIDKSLRASQNGGNLFRPQQ